MGAGGSRAVLDAPALEPLKTYESISPDDEYWSYLLSHRVLLSQAHPLIQAAVSGFQAHPANVTELLHQATVALLDLVHRFDLGQGDADLHEALKTAALLTYVSIVGLGTSADCASVLAVEYDDSGPLGRSLATVLAKLLLLHGATLPTGLQIWSETPADDGSTDDLRAIAIDSLLLLRTWRVEILEFRKALFASSVMNSLLVFYRVPIGIRFRDLRTRLRMVHGGLVLMFFTESTLAEVQYRDDDVETVCEPLVNTPLHGSEAAVTETFFVPLLIQFLMLQDVRVRRPLNIVFLENCLRAADRSYAEVLGNVCTHALVEIAGIPEIQDHLAVPSSSFRGQAPVHRGTLGSVLVELALLNVDARPNPRTARSLAVLIARRLPVTVLPIGPLKLAFKIMADQFDFTSQVIVVRALHWTVGRRSPARADLYAVVLARMAMLGSIFAAHPEVSELRELLDWCQRQSEKMGETRAELTLAELGAMLRSPDNLVPTFDVPEEPPVAEFNFQALRDELSWNMMVDYFLLTADVAVNPL